MVDVEWRNLWAGGAAGDVADRGSVRVTRHSPRYRDGQAGRPYWVVNIRPLHRDELTLPEAFPSLDAGKAAAEDWFHAQPPPGRTARSGRSRRVPNRPD